MTHLKAYTAQSMKSWSFLWCIDNGIIPTLLQSDGMSAMERQSRRVSLRMTPSRHNWQETAEECVYMQLSYPHCCLLLCGKISWSGRRLQSDDQKVRYNVAASEFAPFRGLLQTHLSSHLSVRLSCCLEKSTYHCKLLQLVEKCLEGIRTCRFLV